MLSAFNAKDDPAGGGRLADARIGKISLARADPSRVPPSARFWRHAHLVTPNTARQGVEDRVAAACAISAPRPAAVGRGARIGKISLAGATTCRLPLAAYPLPAAFGTTRTL